MTTATILRETYGPRRRLLCAIDGLQHLIWQDDGTGVPPARNARWTPDVTDLVALEPPDGELSWGVNIGDMGVEPSAMTIAFRDVDDPAAPTTKFFGKLFAPGRHSSAAQKSVHLTRYPSTDPYVASTATTLYVKPSNSAWPASGLAYTSRETFEYASVNGTAFLTCQRGLFSCTDPTDGDTRWAPTYKVPDYSSTTIDELGIEISTVPYSWIGRRIAIYAVAYDDDLGAWRTQVGESLQIDAAMLWIGRINSIRYKGSRGVWELGCEHILADLEEEIAKGMPRAQIYGINMRGPMGTTFKIWVEKSSPPPDASGSLTIPSGVYKTHQDLAAAMNKLMGPVHCKLHFDGSRYTFDAWNYTGGNDVYFWILPAPDDITAEDPDYRCHAWTALGFDLENQVAAGPLAAGAHGYLSASRPPAVAYHPLARAANGWKCHCSVFDAADKASLWDASQSDYGASLATAEITTAIFDYAAGSDTEKHAFRFRYNSLTTTTYVSGTGVVGTLVIIPDAALDLAFKYLHNAYAARLLGEDQCELRNVYVPSYYNNGGRARGPFELLLYTLCSTGTTDANGSTYDKLPFELAGGMQASLVDDTSFLLADYDILGNQLAQRRDYIIGEPVSWLDLLKRECKLFGYVLAWDASQSKLSLRSVYAHDIDTFTETISDSNGVDPLEFPDVDMSAATVINRWEVSILHDRVTGKFKAPIIVEDEDSIQQLRTAKTVSVKHPGVFLAEGVIEGVDQIVRDIFMQNRYCWRYPWMVVTKTLAPYLINRISIADIVRFTSSRIPDPYGGGTMSTSAIAFVTNIVWNLTDWTGKATLLLYSGYDAAQVVPWAWSAVTVSWTAGTYRLTVVEKTWGAVADSDDAAEAQTGDKLDIVERAPANPLAPQRWLGLELASNYETDGAGVLTFVATTTLTGWDATKQYIVLPALYPSAVTAQKTENAYQADKTTPLLGGTDPAHRYG